ncbi:MAG: SMC-Scp complex subunit ScpB, partial [Oscillospiraceae bacterium]|nr:SMC-Scp complex subunit ScpB [Oscillospiraceae bacterium]
RGVDSTSSVKTLLDRGLVEEAGRLEIPGRPLSYKTTAHFLRSFSLNSLADLPKIKAEKTEGQLSTDDLTGEDEYNDLDS